ncbi:hypothetical protein [Metabacillus iocasae]|uniref:Cytochrome c-type biogenesis protein CcmE n=1 Tax=Priestia iocasae TaxID=2291674 RepID=A0ABS2QSC8_9BACI|nr:hypothetical protein [Metabacillus iocasae]MBM7702351.1 cytochrome c-type biogenesis protein CcmE [Metabacillus iocasae]
MSNKRFLAALLGAGLSLVTLVSLIFYIIDPLFYYREQTLYRSQYIADARYQMPGLLRNREYETIITATSMGRNFRESYVDEKLNTTSFNGSLPASYAKEQAMVAQFALQEQKKVGHVIWELNFYSFAEEPDMVLKSSTPFPTYMYDQYKVNDIRYLFSSYNVDILQKNLEANKVRNERSRDVESLYKFGEVAPPETIERITKWLEETGELDELPENERREVMLTSFRENVIPLLEKHRDTTFTFFYAPYPVYNHRMFYEKHPDYLEERLAFKKEVFQLLSKYDNVQLYDFQDDATVTHNIKNYMGDAVHYYEFINNQIIDRIATEHPIRSMEEYEEKIENLRKQVIDFQVSEL